MWHYLRDPTFSHFDTIPECDRHSHTHTHTHRQTDRHTTTACTALSIASRGKNWLINVEDKASQISVIFGKQHDWSDQISGVHVSPGSADSSKGRWDAKSPFSSAITLQHLCKKLPKSVNVHWSYRVLHQCRFFWDTVYCYWKVWGQIHRRS